MNRAFTLFFLILLLGCATGAPSTEGLVAYTISVNEELGFRPHTLVVEEGALINFQAANPVTIVNGRLGIEVSAAERGILQVVVRPEEPGIYEFQCTQGCPRQNRVFTVRIV